MKFKTLLFIALIFGAALIPAINSQVVEDIEDEDDVVPTTTGSSSNSNIQNFPEKTDTQSVNNDVNVANANGDDIISEEKVQAKKKVYNFDDDEFEGLDVIKRKKASKNEVPKSKSAGKKPQQPEGPKMSTFEALTLAFKNKTIWDFKMEIGFISFAIVYVLLVFVGKIKNQNYVVKFVNTTADFLTYNFAVIGSSTALREGTCGEKVSLHEYNLPLTGRKNMKAACLHFVVK